jgi:hypothetical protein
MPQSTKFDHALAILHGRERAVPRCPVHGVAPQIQLGDYVYCAREKCNERMVTTYEKVEKPRRTRRQSVERA